MKVGRIIVPPVTQLLWSKSPKVSEKHSVMKFDLSNKFDFCYYGQVNSLRLKASVASKWASKHLWGNTYFAGDGTCSNEMTSC